MSVFFDSIISAFICFMVSLATFNYYRIPYPLNLTFALLIAIASFLILVAILKVKSQKHIRTTQDKKLFVSFCNQLCCNTNQANNFLLLKAVKKAGYNAIISQNMLKIEQSNVCLFPIFCFDKVSANALIDCYKKTLKNYKTVVICTPLSGEAVSLASNLSARIIVIEIEKLFVYLKENALLPPITVNMIKAKKRLRDLVKESFTKRRSGHFFYVGLIMLVFSFFVFYPKYYLIMGTLFCTIGLTCLLYGKKT